MTRRAFTLSWGRVVESGGIGSVSDDGNLQKQRELRAFLFLTIVLAPILSVLIVGGYGFIVWMYQLMVGPPGS